MELADEAARLARDIRWLILDVDGVLTDGRILFLPGQDDEAKSFHSRDGLGIRLAIGSGLSVALISGRSSSTVERRARELGISEVHQGTRVKLDAYHRLRDRVGLSDDQVCYVGDDLVDLPVMRVVGLPAAVADAHAEVRRTARVVSTRPGGHGAVREIIEGILHAQGAWDSAVNSLWE